jgi:putative ATP-dependent endonuclease of OLD family
LDFLQHEYGGVQIILTSHSPTITSALELNNLIVLTQSDQRLRNILLKNTGIADKDKKALKKYLDVTKSQLFFARRLIFVEGISEALLIRALWNIFFRSTPEDQFNRQGIEIVNIGGISFTPYVELFRHVFPNQSVRAVVITDDDRGTGRDCPEQYRFILDGKLKDREKLVSIFDNAPQSARFNGLKQSIDTLQADGISNLGIFGARKTLEVELGMANPDKVASFLGLVGIQKALLPNASPLLAGLTLWDEIDSRSKKADFYLDLVESDLIEGLVIPTYIKEAINFLNESTDKNPKPST